LIAKRFICQLFLGRDKLLYPVFQVTGGAGRLPSGRIPASATLRRRKKDLYMRSQRGASVKKDLFPKSQRGGVRTFTEHIRAIDLRVFYFYITWITDFFHLILRVIT
jgi:hypothetical protein